MLGLVNSESIREKKRRGEKGEVGDEKKGAPNTSWTGKKRAGSLCF